MAQDVEQTHRDLVDLIAAFRQIQDAKLRRQIIAVVTAIAQDGERVPPQAHFLRLVSSPGSD